jgi:PAS domain-containing protein
MRATKRRGRKTSARGATVCSRQCYTFQVVDKDASRLRVLADAVRSFTEATSDYRQLLDIIVERIASVVLHHCAIRLLTPDREYLELAAHYDIDPHARTLGERVMGSARLRVDSPHLTSRVIETGTALLIRDADLRALEHEIMPDIWAAMVELQVRSLLYVPLRVHREVIGVLSIARRGKDAPLLGEEDVELAQVMADYAAMSISNERLFSEVRRQNAARRRAEDTLRMIDEARRFAQAVVDGAREPLLVLDPQLRVRAANRAFHRTYGLELAQIRDRALATLPGWDHPPLSAMLADLLMRRSESLELALEQDVGDKRRSIVVHARPLDVPRGDSDAVLLSIQDRTGPCDTGPARTTQRTRDLHPGTHLRLPAVAVGLVDADDARADQTLRTLRQHGLHNEVVRARDRNEALSLLLASDAQVMRRPDRPARLVLLALEPIDLALDVLRHRQHDPLARAVPVVVLSPRAGHPTIAEVRRLGASAIAIEPFGLDALARVLHSLGMSWLLLGSKS